MVLWTLGERAYGENFTSLAMGELKVAQVIDQYWHGVLGVREEAIFWRKPILTVGFLRRIKRSRQPFFRKTVRLERRMRSATGVLVPYRICEA